MAFASRSPAFFIREAMSALYWEIVFMGIVSFDKIG
jgi:hypothetical protein